jgi:hypothetical protein
MKPNSFLVEVLYFSGCPSWKKTVEDLNSIFTEKGVEPDIKLVKVETDEDAKKNKFPGSPTIRLDGRDLFPVDLPDYSLQCRVYSTPDGLKGTPSREMLNAKFSKLLNEN